MQHQVFLLHAECIKCADDTLLLLNLMHDKHRDHIGKERENDDARGQSGVSVHDDIACRRGNADIVRRFHK